MSVMPPDDRYRPIYPDSPFIHVADLVNPKTNKTWREENADKTHTIKLGSLVEIKDTGARLFVVRLDRDCDMTPMYGLHPEPPKDISETDLRFKVHGGYIDENLTVIGV